MTAEFQHDVFLSRSATDKAVVRAVAERLRQGGLKVWFAEWVLKPGDMDSRPRSAVAADVSRLKLPPGAPTKG